MFLILLVYIVALTLESLGSYLSVVGLAAKTGPVLIMIAITLDCSKIIIASVLYKRWKTVHLAFKLFFVPVLICLVLFTSTGTVGFLTKQLGNTTAISDQQKTQLDSLQSEKEKLEKRKETIDSQITQLPATSVTARKRLTDLFAKETTDITDRLNIISKDILDIQSKTVQARSDNGTMASIASAWGIAPEAVIKIVALVLAIFIDPLAIALLSLANFLSEERKKELAKPKDLYSRNNPWDKFRMKFFSGKGTFDLFTKNIIHPYTDSKGHLLKTVKYLPTQPFLLSVSLFKADVKPIHFHKERLSPVSQIREFVPPEPVLTKNIIHLTPKRLIQKISSFDFPIEKILKKSNDFHLSSSLFLQEEKSPLKLEKSIVSLNTSSFIKESSLENELSLFPVLDSYQKLPINSMLSDYSETEYKHSIHVPILATIQNVKPIEIEHISNLENNITTFLKTGTSKIELENIEEIENIKIQESSNIIEGFKLNQLSYLDINNPQLHIIDLKDKEESQNHEENLSGEELIKKIIAKPKPETLSFYNNDNKGDGFFEKGEPVKFVPSNVPEDIYIDYDEAIVFWDNDDDHFDIGLRPVLPIQVKGFETKKELLNHNF